MSDVTVRVGAAPPRLHRVRHAVSRRLPVLDPRPPAPPERQGEGDAVASRRSWRLDALVVVGVCAVVAAVQYAVFPGPQRSDPEYYFYLARHLPQAPANWWSLRIGLVWLVRASYLVLGPTELALYLVPAAASLLLAASTYGIMRVLFGDRIVAVAAALVVALNPDFLLDGLFLYPDPLATATFTAAFLLLIVGRPQPGRPDTWGVRAAVVGAGALFGWTYLVREYSPVLLPAVVLALVLFGYRLRRIALMVAATVAVFSLELIYGQLRYGDAFVRLHVLLKSKSKRTGALQHQNWAPFREKVHNVVDSALVLPRLLLAWNDGWVIIALIALLVVALVTTRRRPLFAIAGWFFSYWAVMTAFGVIHTKSGDPIVFVSNIRYWYPLFPALVIGGFGGLALLGRGADPSRRRAGVTQLSAVVVAGLILVPGVAQYNSCRTQEVWRSDAASSWSGVRSFLASSQGQQYGAITTDSHAVRTIVPYLQTRLGGRTLWHGDLAVLAPRTVPAPDPKGLVLVNGLTTSFSTTQDFLSGWAPVWVSPDHRMALLADRATATPVSAAQRQAWLTTLQHRPVVTPGSCGVSPYQRASG